jgi:SSS family solute:Na+ symporter/sodium/pantothenate symporter
MPDAAGSPGAGTLAALLIFIVASVWLGTIAQRVVQRGSFLKGYFLGNRALGSWALALTATVQSGGTFMGFPSLVYSHGWIVALWIAGYMVVPITGFGVLGKRVAQISRRTGAITVPDLLRERFGSPTVGLVASLFIMFFMSFMMVAQFKAGALVMKISWPGTGALALSEDAAGGIDRAYYIGLAIFAFTVVGYTLIGGFLAAVWTDLFQSVMMLAGVVMLLILAVPAAGGMEQATRQAVAATGPEFAFGPGYAVDGRQFLPVGLAFSFFFTWVFSGLASPASVVRIMACRDTGTIRRSIFLLNSYNLLIYPPLIVICICARAIMPRLAASDEVIPRMALLTTSELPGGSFLAGLILAAPFGAVMATVSSYLVVIASGLVRDVYQRFLHPAANETEMRRLSYILMVVVGMIAVAANIKPVQYLQAIVVFSGTSAAATFVTPALMTAFWRRATAAGTLAAMASGAGTMLVLFALGWMGTDPMIGQATRFRPYYLLGLEPIVWGLAASLAAGIVVSLCTTPPDAALVSQLFDEAQGKEEGGTRKDEG